jgi:hypothetical protein
MDRHVKALIQDFTVMCIAVFSLVRDLMRKPSSITANLCSLALRMVWTSASLRLIVLSLTPKHAIDRASPALLLGAGSIRVYNR